MARREVERRGGGERDPDYPRKQPVREPAQAPRRPQLNEYFLEGEGINRQVLQGEICKYLGPEAYCHPAELKGVHGYKIKALRPFTPDMVHDIKLLSGEFMQENHTLQKQSRAAVTYEESDTHQNRNVEYERGFPPSTGSSSNAYGSVTSPYAPDQRHPPYSGATYAPGPGPGPAYAQSSYSMPPGMESVPAYGGAQPDPRHAPNYTYTQPPRGEYPPQGYSYSSNYGYAPGDYGAVPRSRPEGMGGVYYPSGPNPPRMEDQQRSYYDSQMGGMQAPPTSGYGAPRQTNNTSPYETVQSQRESFAGRQPPSDIYRRN